MHETAKKRREENLARWRQFGGGKCGLSEFIIKGGMDNERTSEDAERELSNGSAVNGAAVAVNGDSAALNGSEPVNKEVSRDEDNFITVAGAHSESQGVSTTAPLAEKAASDEQHSLERNAEDLTNGGAKEVNGDRARANSSDSFVTSRETTSPSVAADGGADRLDAALSGKSRAGTGNESGLETGVAGLVIKEDGSLGAP